MTMYSYSTDEEKFNGDFATEKEAIDEALSENPGRDVVYVGENKKYSAHDFVSGNRILEDVAERAYDDAGEWAEDWLAGLMEDKEKCAELKKLVADWIDANEPPYFGTVTNVTEVKRHDKDCKQLGDKHDK